jgi:hypothetical protein
MVGLKPRPSNSSGLEHKAEGPPDRLRPRLPAGSPLEPGMPVEALRHELRLPDRALIPVLVTPPLTVPAGASVDRYRRTTARPDHRPRQSLRGPDPLRRPEADSLTGPRPRPSPARRHRPHLAPGRRRPRRRPADRRHRPGRCAPRRAVPTPLPDRSPLRPRHYPPRRRAPPWPPRPPRLTHCHRQPSRGDQPRVTRSAVTARPGLRSPSGSRPRSPRRDPVPPRPRYAQLR